MTPQKEPVIYGFAAIAATQAAAIPTPTVGALAGVPLGPIFALVTMIVGVIVRKFTSPAANPDAT
jgi:hypothetical protein